MGLRAVAVTVTVGDRVQLESITRSQSLPAALAWRAKMILRRAHTEPYRAVAERYEARRPTVSPWHKQYAEHGLVGLHNELELGWPRSTNEDAIAGLIQTALTRKPRGRTHWSRRSLAEATGLTESTVHRYRPLFGVQSHRSESFKLSNDPFSMEKVRDIVGLYLNPPDRAPVLCGLEKPMSGAGTHAAGFTHGPGLRPGRTHDYFHHRTTLFAALDVPNGTVLAQCKPNHRHHKFPAFLRHIEAQRPGTPRCAPDLRQLRHPQACSSERLAGAPPTLFSALQAHLQFLAESGRALVCVDHSPGDPSRLLRFGCPSQAQDRYLRETLQPAPQAIPVDCYRRVDPRQTRAVV